MLTFGVTVLPDPPHTRFVELMQLAEEHGFEYGWTYDSHILWHDAYPLLTLLPSNTERLKFGPLRHEPGDARADGDRERLRDAPRHLGGRMVMGIGRGDSARRVIGYKPVKMAEFEAPLVMMKDLMNGRPVEWNGKELELTWAQGRPEIPMYVAGVRAERAGRRRPRRRRRHHPARRPRDHPVDHGAGPRGGRGGRPRPRRAQVPRLRAEHRHGRHAGGARRGPLVPGDGLEPRHGPDRALRRGLGDPEGADRVREGAEVLRLQGPQPRRRGPRRVRHRRDLRPLLRASAASSR